MNHTSRSSYLLSVEVDFLVLVTFRLGSLNPVDSIFNFISGGLIRYLTGALRGVKWKDLDVYGGATICYSLIASVDCYS